MATASNIGRKDRFATCTGRSSARSLDKAPNSRSSALLLNRQHAGHGSCGSTYLDCRASHGRVGRLARYRSGVRPRMKRRLCRRAECRRAVICCNGCGRRRRLGLSDGNTELPRPGPPWAEPRHIFHPCRSRNSSRVPGAEMPPPDTRGLQKRINPENPRGQDAGVSAADP